MEALMLWFGFIGAWLLFAGPIYQAALELNEQDIEIDRIRAVEVNIQKPASVSAWWWLLPPVKFVLEQRRSAEYRKRYIKSLSSEDVESLISFMNKATAWLLVAIGGLCIATKETYELAEYEDWNLVVFWVIVAVLIFASILHVIARMKRSRKIIQSSH